MAEAIRTAEKAKSLTYTYTSITEERGEDSQPDMWPFSPSLPETKENNSPNTLCRRQQVEERVRIKVIEVITPLDPDPVSKGDEGADGEGGQEGDGPWGREKEEVEDEDDGGYGVEGEVGLEGQWDRPVGKDELGVNLGEGA